MVRFGLGRQLRHWHAKVHQLSLHRLSFLVVLGVGSHRAPLRRVCRLVTRRGANANLDTVC